MSNLFFIFILYQIKILFGTPNESKNLGDKNEKLRKASDLSDDIVIIHLNDVHCGIDDKIGYDGFVLYRKELLTKYKYVITIDVGDHIQGGKMGAISDGEAIIEIMNKVNFDIVTLGNHEFDYGLAKLSILEEKINTKYICANFCKRKDKKPIYEPYKIIEKGGKKLAFIGVLTPLTYTKTYLSTIKDDDGEPTYDFLEENRGQVLYDTIQNYINELKENGGVDYVFLLTHIGMNVEAYTSNQLLSKIEGVTAVLDGHTHVVYNTTTKDKNNEDIYISQTGTKLETIGQLIIKEDGTINTEIIYNVPEPNDALGGKIINRSNKDRWVDEEMNNFMSNISIDYKDELNTVLGYSDYNLVIKPEETTDSHRYYCRTQECTVGNLISDAVNIAGNGDFSILNGGSIRHNLNKGNITRGNILDMLPWFNNIVIKQFPGKVILDALEFGVSKYPIAFGGFPQISSNLSFDFNPSINSTVICDDVGSFVNVTGERRVTNVKINGQKLDLNKIYNVTLLEFASNGGDGYSMFVKYDVYREALVTDTDALSYYIENNLEGIIPKKYSLFQGRINNINEKSEPNKKNTLTTIVILAIVIPISIIIVVLALILIRKRRNHNLITDMYGKQIDENKNKNTLEEESENIEL